MNTERSVADAIALVERKLEIRRERTRRHWDEVRTQGERSLRWLPLLGAVGALAVGIAAGRRRHAVAATPTRKAGIVAPLAAIGATALRVALSPGGRAVWEALRAGRPR